MKLGFVLGHPNHAYVDSRGGFPFLTYVRAGEGRSAYRMLALQRAMQEFEARDRDSSQPIGLTVLQRAMLCAEDLGRMLYALGGEDPWTRLKNAKMPDIDAAFRTAIGDGGAFRRKVFLLPAQQHFGAEPLSSAELRALLQLCRLLDDRRARMMHSAACLWLKHASSAKATMHGVPIVSGLQAQQPPGAGSLAAGISKRDSPFALVLSSHLKGTELTTDRTVVDLGAGSVSAWCRQGKIATRLYEELCDVQADSIMGGKAAIVPTDLIGRLPAADQETVRRMLAAQGQSL